MYLFFRVPANYQIIISKNNCDNCRVDNCHSLKYMELVRSFSYRTERFVFFLQIGEGMAFTPSLQLPKPLPN